MDAWLLQLKETLGNEAVLCEPEQCAPYQQGARYGQGVAAGVLRPRTVEQAQIVLETLRERDLPFVVQGANTGLVAASTPDASGQQWVVSFERLKETIQIDPLERTATVSAGVRLSELNQAAALYGLHFPIDLSADPCIGGMVATNTGGTQLIKYGDVRANLCALDVWLAGRGRLTFGSVLRKNNTGLDLKQLVCGASGATAIVLSATVRLHSLPRQRATALIVPGSAMHAMDFLSELERDFSEFLAAMESMSASAMQAVFTHQPNVRNPFARGEVPDFALLVELVSSLPTESFALETIWQEWLAQRLEDGKIADALFGDAHGLWQIRHGISEALRHGGKLIAFDICLPRRYWPAFRAWGAAFIAKHYPMLRICDFGHAADGGMHYNLLLPHGEALSSEQIEQLRTQILDKVVNDFQGSFSAEHGIGPYNAAYYQRYTPLAVRELSDAIVRLTMPDVTSGVVCLGR